jgi:predicted site-specific integrase-resolvase
MIKISKLAKDLDVTRTTLYNWKREGKIDFIKSETGRNYVSINTYNRLMGIVEKKTEKVVIYCRVSSTENKSNLDTQKNRLISYCNAKGYQVSEVIVEVGSGINDFRPKLIKLLEKNDYTKIVVEHKDRLTRVGFNYLDTLCKVLGKEIEVVNNVVTDEEDLIQDFVSIITSFCSRIYGKRRSKRNTEKLIKELQEGE